MEAAKDIDRVKDTYRKRAAVIGFRAGVVAHLLAGDGRESKTTADFAIAIAELTLLGQMRTFGEALLHQYVEAADTCQRQGRNMSVFDQLPPTFTLDDLRQLKQGSSLSTISVYVSDQRHHPYYLTKYTDCPDDGCACIGQLATVPSVRQGFCL